MQNNIKTRTTAVIIIVLLMASIMLLTTPVQAQETAHGGNPATGTWSTTIPAGVTVDYTIKAHPYLSFSPNPIGLGQELLVNMWLTPPSAENKYLAGYTVTITKPNQDQDVVGPLNSYVADGTAWFTYIVDQVGEWKLKFSFPGQYFPAGRYLNGEIVTSGGTLYPAHYYSPVSTSELTLTVQNEQVMSWSSPLPTDYWTRPIQPNNREWNVIAGNYPWGQQMVGGQYSWRDEYYGPYITAPNTPHIVWKKQGALAGIIGGETGNYATLSNPGAPSVIYMGRCYQTMTVPINGMPTSSAVCYNLRTGEQYYAIPTASGGITPTHIAYWAGVDTAVPGAGEAASFGVELHTISGGRLYKINPLTGAITANISLPTLSNAEMMYRDGYYLSYNVTGTAGSANEKGVLYNWTAQGSSTNFASRIVNTYNVTIPHSYRAYSVSDLYGLLGAYDPDTGITVIQSRFIYGNVYGYRLEAVNLLTGQLLWNITSSSSDVAAAYRPTNAWCRHGIYVAEMERGYWQAWDERTGKVLWTTEMKDDPWGEFWMYDLAAYQNLLFGVGYTGVWALDEVTGKVVWHYSDPAPPFETPYSSNGTSSYSVQAIRVADGKIYVCNDEHTATQPATRGWGLICLNATTGEFLWKIKGTRMSPGPAADGYLIAPSSYDGYMYVLGKGKSATTIEAPLTAITLGQKVVLKGTVLDMSPAQPGTPCVSKESIAAWMDYLHLQMPIPADVKGVSVSLDTLDPNNNFVHIATVTSDMSGTFSYIWQPEVPGKYTVMATFMGDDSYGSSYAETAVGVVEAPPATPTPEPPQAPPDYTWTIIGTGIAMIIAVAVVGLLILRKRS